MSLDEVIIITFLYHEYFADYDWFPWSICNGCGMPTENAYPSGHLVLSPIMGLACAPIVETRFLELAMSLLDFSPRIPLGTFSILLERISLSMSMQIIYEIYIPTKRSMLKVFSGGKQTYKQKGSLAKI